MNPVIAFMAGPWGRLLRGVLGAGLVVVAVVSGGWGLLVALPGIAMLATGILNYCPAAILATPPADRSEFMASLGPRNLLK